MLIRSPKIWQLPDAAVTPETTYLDRRQLLRALGLGGMALAGTLAGCNCTRDSATRVEALPRGAVPPLDAGAPELRQTTWKALHADLYPVKRNPGYTVPERGISPEIKATRYNNFYEFTVDKEAVWTEVDAFETRPWTVEISGLVRKPQQLDFDQIARTMNLEERVYRFRCVEAWSMTVPWTGFPLRDLLALAEPLPEARFVRFITARRPEEMPGMAAADWYPWPYYEGLRLDEARHELTFVATGLYGRPLPRQNGAPLRLVVPWKYGYKNIKSIVKIELCDTQPATFWNDLAPREYDFWSNVNPEIPHPRWSQATERLIDTGDRIPTLPFNGYGQQVASLYTG